MAASDDRDARWWTAASKVGATVIGIPAFVGAVGVIFSWSALAIVLAAVVVVVATATAIPVRGTIRLGLGLAGVLAIALVAGLVMGSGDHRKRHAFSAGTPKKTKQHQTTRGPGPREVGTSAREVLPAGDAVLAVTEARTVVQMEAESFSQLGASLVSEAPIQHLADCADRVLATFGDGSISAIDRARMQFGKEVAYGRPVPNEHLGEMTCGDDGSVYVAMPAEARVVQLRVDPLGVEKEIRVGKEVTALAFTNHTLYVADSGSAAIITVNPDGVPWRWIVTTQAPDRLLPLRNGSVLVTHARSACLGLAMEGVAQEQGAGWSARGSIVASAVGPEFGVVVDSTGFMYRFDSGGGDLISRPLRVPGASAATTAAVMANGHVLLSTGTGRQLTDVAPSLWRGSPQPARPAHGCLPAS